MPSRDYRVLSSWDQILRSFEQFIDEGALTGEALAPKVQRVPFFQDMPQACEPFLVPNYLIPRVRAAVAKEETVWVQWLNPQRRAGIKRTARALCDLVRADEPVKAYCGVWLAAFVHTNLSGSRSSDLSKEKWRGAPYINCVRPLIRLLHEHVGVSWHHQVTTTLPASTADYFMQYLEVPDYNPWDALVRLALVDGIITCQASELFIFEGRDKEYKPLKVVKHDHGNADSLPSGG